MKTPSPSKLELVAACPAAWQRCLPFPFVENEYTRRGKDLHEIVRIFLECAPEAWGTVKQNIFSKLDPKDQEAVETCLEVAQMLKPAGNHLKILEQKLDLAFLGIPQGGTPDFGYYDIGSGVLVVVDWKFGSQAVPDPDENKQLHAYAVGATKWLLQKYGYRVQQAMLVVCQPHGRAVESYRQVLIPATEFDKLEGMIRSWVEASLAEKPTAFPGIHCKRCFCEAGKQGACEEFRNWEQNGQDQREARKDLQASSAVAGFQPIVIEGPGPSFPLVVFSEEAIQRAKDLEEQAVLGLVADQSSADSAGRLLSEITTFESQIERNRKALKAPVLELGKSIDQKTDAALVPLAQAKVTLKTKIDAWMKQEKDRIAREAEEAAKKKQEAEEAQRKADQEAAEALKKAQQEGSAEAIETARKAKEEADRKAQEVQAASTAAAVPVAAPKVAGVAVKKKVEYTVTDFAKMPDTYKIVNERVLKAAVETGAVTMENSPWIKIERSDKASSTGRK